MRAIICLLLGIYFFSVRASATVEEWQIIGEPSRVAINFSSNHDYYPRTWPYAFHAYVAVLEALRQELVRQGKLEDVPIAFQLSDKQFAPIMPVDGGTDRSHSVELKTVALRRGESEEMSTARRYIVKFNLESLPQPTATEFFEELLAVTLSLKDLNAQNLSLTSNEYTSQIAQIQNLVQHFDPIWSPDGKFLVFASWQEAHFEFLVLDLARMASQPLKATEQKLGKIRLWHDTPACRPIWSPDGKFLACADLNAVSVLKSDTMQTSVYKLSSWQRQSALIRNSHIRDANETLLKFRKSEPKRSSLLVSCDTNLFSDYATVELDAENLSESKAGISSVGLRPKWAADSMQQARLFDKRRAVSPTGEWTALIEETRGVRRLVLRSRDGRQTFRVSDAPGISLEANEASQNQSGTRVSTVDSAPRETDARWKILVAGAAVLLGLSFFVRKFFERPSA